MSSSSSLSLSLLLVVLAVAALARGADPIVQIGQGRLRGLTSEGVDRFLGIPFAAPPVGGLRWMRPQAAKGWPGVRNALTFGDDCLSTKSNYIKLQNTSENCLFLNVWRPASTAAAGAALPVMVFFYGGSWEYGGSSFPVYDGGPLVRTGGVILVTVNYRLGPFGFLASPALAQRDPLGSTGNYGSYLLN